MKVSAEVAELREGGCVVQSPTQRTLKVGANLSFIHEVMDLCEHAESVKALKEKGGLTSAQTSLVEHLDLVGCLSSVPPSASHHGISLTVIADDEDKPLVTDGLAELVTPGGGTCTQLRVLALPFYDEALVSAFAEENRAAQLNSVTIIGTGQDSLVIGPLSLAGQPPAAREAMTRRRLCASDPEAMRALLQPALRMNSRPSAATLRAGVALLAIQLRPWLVTGDCPLVWGQIELNTREGSIVTRPVLPLPDGPFVAPPRDLTFESAIDPRTGIICAVYPVLHDDEVPSRLKTFQTRAMTVQHEYAWANNETCGGSAFDDATSARNAAIGEAFERYSGNFPHPEQEFHSGSYNTLSRGKTRVLDPDTLILYGDELYARPGSPYVRFTRDVQTQWIPGTSLSTGERVLLPAQFCYAIWGRGRFQDDPRLIDISYPGIAAGANLNSALLSGLQEVIERDATMVWWLNNGQVPRLPLSDSERAIWAEDRCRNQRAWALEIPNEFKLPVVAGIVHNPAGPFLNAGFACKGDLSKATLKAWTEALTLQEGSRDLINANSRQRAAIARGELNECTVRRFREDRSYLNDFQPDFSDIDDLMVQQTVFLDPRSIDHVLPMLEGSADVTATSVPVADDLASWQRRVEGRGYEIFYADLTTSDVSAVGGRVVRVIVPGLVFNSPAGLPHLGSPRVQDQGVELRMVPARQSLDQLNRWPLPHA